jgi:hypothetical protein
VRRPRRAGFRQVDVGDPAGVLTAWFARHEVGAVVLRPDRFVYATGVTVPVL